MRTRLPRADFKAAALALLALATVPGAQAQLAAAAAAASAPPPRMSPHAAAARQRALAASEPQQIGVSPLTQHKPHRPAASGRPA